VGSLSIPLAYVAYTLIGSPFITYTQDGRTRHWYPYHFLDVDDLGYGRVLGNIVGIFLLLLAVSGVFLYLNRKLPERPTRSTATLILVVERLDCSAGGSDPISRVRAGGCARPAGPRADRMHLRR
jgi:hypothetical protein